LLKNAIKLYKKKKENKLTIIIGPTLEKVSQDRISVIVSKMDK
jgi:hypothetical protein